MKGDVVDMSSVRGPYNLATNAQPFSGRNKIIYKIVKNLNAN